jgi:hypothetical protein
LIASLLSDFTHNGPDGFTATNAVAAAADIKVTTLAMRRCGTRPLRVNQRGVFICLEMLTTSWSGESELGGRDYQDNEKNVNVFNIIFL